MTVHLDPRSGVHGHDVPEASADLLRELNHYLLG